METAAAIQERVSREKPAGKTPLLAALAAQHLKDTASNPVQRPATPAKPASAPAAAAPAAVMPSAANIASAMLDEQERRAKAALVKTREAFTAMKPSEQLAFCKSGGKIVN